LGNDKTNDAREAPAVVTAQTIAGTLHALVDVRRKGSTRIYRTRKVNVEKTTERKHSDNISAATIVGT
jgi:hypothetical protein